MRYKLTTHSEKVRYAETGKMPAWSHADSARGKGPKRRRRTKTKERK